MPVPKHHFKYVWNCARSILSTGNEDLVSHVLRSLYPWRDSLVLLHRMLSAPLSRSASGGAERNRCSSRVQHPSPSLGLMTEVSRHVPENIQSEGRGCFSGELCFIYYCTCHELQPVGFDVTCLRNDKPLQPLSSTRSCLLASCDLEVL